jgi:hypothetical protein
MIVMTDFWVGTGDLAKCAMNEIDRSPLLVKIENTLFVIVFAPGPK